MGGTEEFVSKRHKFSLREAASLNYSWSRMFMESLCRGLGEHFDINPDPLPKDIIIPGLWNLIVLAMPDMIKDDKIHYLCVPEDRGMIFRLQSRYEKGFANVLASMLQVYWRAAETIITIDDSAGEEVESLIEEANIVKVDVPVSMKYYMEIENVDALLVNDKQGERGTYLFTAFYNPFETTSSWHMRIIKQIGQIEKTIDGADEVPITEYAIMCTEESKEFFDVCLSFLGDRYSPIIVKPSDFNATSREGLYQFLYAASEVRAIYVNEREDCGWVNPYWSVFSCLAGIPLIPLGQTIVPAFDIDEERRLHERAFEEIGNAIAYGTPKGKSEVGF